MRSERRQRGSEAVASFDSSAIASSEIPALHRYLSDVAVGIGEGAALKRSRRQASRIGRKHRFRAPGPPFEAGDPLSKFDNR